MFTLQEAARNTLERRQEGVLQSLEQAFASLNVHRDLHPMLREMLSGGQNQYLQ